MRNVDIKTIDRFAQRQPYARVAQSCQSARKHPAIHHCAGHMQFAQQGVSLVVSLVLLATMTIIGVTTMSGTRLNEQMASNSQQKSIVFEAAESSIESIVNNYDDLFDALTDTTVALDNPDAVSIPDSLSNLDEGFDLRNPEDVLVVNVDGSLSVQYCGEAQLAGTSLDASLDSVGFTSVLVDINGIANISNSGASADHMRRVALTLPQTGRSGNCQTR